MLPVGGFFLGWRVWMRGGIAMRRCTCGFVCTGVGALSVFVKFCMITKRSTIVQAVFIRLPYCCCVWNTIRVGVSLTEDNPKYCSATTSSRKFIMALNLLEVSADTFLWFDWESQFCVGDTQPCNGGQAQSIWWQAWTYRPIIAIAIQPVLNCILHANCTHWVSN